jgi:hypothetical protein
MCLPACLPACLRASLPACLPACPLTCSLFTRLPCCQHVFLSACLSARFPLSARLPGCLPARLPASDRSMPACLPARPPARLPACLSSFRPASLAARMRAYALPRDHARPCGPGRRVPARPRTNERMSGGTVRTCLCAHVPWTCGHVSVWAFACLRGCMLACLRACVPAHLHACLPACLFGCLPACLLACLLACLQGGCLPGCQGVWCLRSCARACHRIRVCALPCMRAGARAVGWAHGPLRRCEAA